MILRACSVAAFLLAAMLGFAASSTLAADVAPFTVTPAIATGPIASTATNFPFIADGFSVEPPVPEGYVEDEFFFSGTANLYQFTSTGIEIVSPCPAIATRGCSNLSYTTRMLIKRPSDPAKFSGNVIIEPLNPSADFDIAGVWDRSADFFVRNGDIFIGWSCKSIIVDQTLKSFNKTRYAALNFPYMPSPDGNANDGVYDGITFDIAAQLGALIKLNGPMSPLHQYDIHHVIEAGFSQDGTFAFSQAETFNALERLPNGSPIYDGYVPGGTNGPANLDFGLTAQGALPAGDKRLQMQPRDVPVIQIDTETEIFLGTFNPIGLSFQRSDSDALDDRYRLIEVPGASHVSNDNNMPVIPLQLNFAELNGLTPSMLPPDGCTHQAFVPGPTMGAAGVLDPNNFPFSFVADAAFANLEAWIDLDLPPPHAAIIDVDTTKTPPSIVRDQFGNAEGGLRTPFVDVPITSFVPFDTAAHQTLLSGFCILDGYNLPFDAAALKSLYPTHQNYVVRFAADAGRLVVERLWLPEDAAKAINEARLASVP
jgi:Alpha/beta hydrolase domain